MEKKPTKCSDKDKPNWDWTHVECYLKTIQNNRKSTIWNLSPGIILTNPSTDTSGPSVRLYIDTQKSLQYSHQLGWNWHKSWNIPNISLRLEIKDENTGDFLLAPRNLYAQIFAVKKNAENDKLDRTTLVDVGIRGQSKMEMIDGQVYFSAIKFSSTTYNNQGVNFNLLIVLYINEGQFEKPKVLTAVVSPPIFVDSRRSARDYQQKKFSSFVEPFAYDTLEKQFIKRQNKSKCESQIIIKNDPEGFYNYITAPNIRHKVKHPVFLAIKFSNCVRIYFNDKLVTGTQMQELLEQLQTKLLKENKSKQKNDIELATNLDQKCFVFGISNLNDSLKRKKVLQSIETMQNEYIGIACGLEDLPESMQQISPIQTMRKAYKESYDNLMAICQNYQPEEQDESDDQYSQQQDESSNSQVRKKPEVEPPKTTRNKTTIISNKKQPAHEKPVAPKVQKSEEIKKEELFEPHFQGPAFFNAENQQAKKSGVTSSAFSKAVGFRNVNNHPENNIPIFDTSDLNKAFSSNMGHPQFNEPKKGQQIKNPVKETSSPQNNEGFPPTKPVPANSQSSFNVSQGLGQMQGNLSMGGTFGLGGGNNFINPLYNNLMFGNSALSNYLSNVKSNNSNLYDGMMNPNLSDQLMNKGNTDRSSQSEQHQKMLQMMNRQSPQTDDQQSILCLVQQIALYKQLLAQVSYQNQLLARDINIKQQGNINQSFPNNNMNMNFMNMSGMDVNPSLSNLANPPLNNLGSMSNLSSTLNSMNNMGALGNMGNLGNFQSASQNILNSNMHNAQMNLPNMMANQQQQRERELSQPQQQTQPQPLQGVPQEGQGMNSANYEMIKNMLREELKRQARQKQQNP